MLAFAISGLAALSMAASCVSDGRQGITGSASSCSPGGQAWLTSMWATQGWKWQCDFPLCRHKDLGSWLFARQQSGVVVGLGCKVCHLAGSSSRAGKAGWQTPRSCRSDKFQAHTRRPSHIQAAAQLNLCDQCTAENNAEKDIRAAPSSDEFMQVWKARQRGDVTGSGLKRIAGHSIKRDQIQFCIAEAMRMQDREHVSESVTLVTHVDGKGKLLSMRASATSLNLVTKRIFMGHVQHTSKADTVEAYVESINKLLRNFCVTFHNAPARRTTVLNNVCVSMFLRFNVFAFVRFQLQCFCNSRTKVPHL